MPYKIIHFLKYNNATIVILAVILLLGGGALAAGPEGLGEKKTSVQGTDNTALLTADLKNFSMDFKIEKVESDELYYYATYSYLDLAVKDQAWQYQLSQETAKISKKIKEDLGAYLAKYLAKHYQARLRELKREQREAAPAGEQKRLAVTEYSGLIGKTLDLAAKVFPGYESVKKVELKSPPLSALPAAAEEMPVSQGVSAAAGADSLTEIYNDYIAEHPELFAPSADEATTTAQQPIESAPEAAAGQGTTEAETPAAADSVQIIQLPPAAAPAETPAGEQPAAEPVSGETAPPETPAPVESAQ